MVVVVFRSKSRAGFESDAATKGSRMYELATGLPGFISYKDFASSDGETLALVEFADHDSLAAWRDHPEHREAQAWGRDTLFVEYQVQVCDVVRVARSSE
jgi:heme-degrading monooxygenase HmoA